MTEHPADRLRGLAQLAPVLANVETYLESAADPAAVAVGLQRLVEAKTDPGANINGWMRLIDHTPAAVETLLNRPHLVSELPHDRGRYERAGFERELDEALRSLPDLKTRLDHLRTIRVEETLRIAWLDVVEGADLTVVTRRISDLAETLTERVLREVQRELSAKYGRPWHRGEPVGLAVIAMGKLGGAELNYSSDIDLIFVYGKDGETDGGTNAQPITNREFFHRLCERMSREFNAVSAHGKLYRCDLRLRPEGSLGSLARTLAASVAYYRKSGETWERQAFLKARPIAGDRTIGDEFVARVREWAYGRGLSFEEISALKHVKRRIEKATRSRGQERGEVKTGYGGIRDVEYVVQFLQLMHGSRRSEVRHHNSLIALRLLEQFGAIRAEERNALDDAYRFLRTVEHRLQLVQGAQTHRIPNDAAESRALARRMGFAEAAEFHVAYNQKAEQVRTILDRIFRKSFLDRDAEQVSETDLMLDPQSNSVALGEVLARHGIKDIAAGFWHLYELSQEPSRWLQGSARTPSLLADLFPRLIDELKRTPDPDAALKRLERITAKVGARGTLYQALLADERLLHLLVTLAGNSRFLTNILARSPGVLDQLVDAWATDPGRGLSSFEDIPTATVPEAATPARILADYRNLELLRIGLRDLTGARDLRGVGADLTRLAEILLQLALARARREAGSSGADLCVCALGKLGGREMLYGSDVDLVFFCRSEADRTGASAVARRLRSLIGTPGPHGKLYDVDLRLRPGGLAGPLITTPSGFRDYFARGLGQCWERMAWTRARAVAGPPSLCEKIEACIAEATYQPGFGADDARSMLEMREKLAVHAEPGSLKRARSGGVVDLEFVAQLHALRHGHENAEFREGNVHTLLRRLQAADRIPAQHAADMEAAYTFLVSLESRIRIVADLREDRLPDQKDELRQLASRLGYVDTGAQPAEETLREEYAYHRDVAARSFLRAISEIADPS
ncbi:MAG: bifunctional [glutamate--ammonia ligase]-adenylyl-L-tyrosine phosphorylase/[glutamate--ammonia-ligase] adenylyltransferase [Planctomycetota bacterium]